jgi:hypothetical protein
MTFTASSSNFVVLIDSFKASPQKLPAQGGEHKPLGNGFQKGDKSVTTVAKKGILRSKRQKKTRSKTRAMRRELEGKNHLIFGAKESRHKIGFTQTLLKMKECNQISSFWLIWI